MASQTHLRPNSRIVGYLAALAVGLIGLVCSWRIYVNTQLERDFVWVHFTGSGDLIGSLQEDDPVAIQGVDVGQVEEIQSNRDGVRVGLRFWKHQRLFRDAQATNVGNGLMGMRFVLLERGVDSTHSLDRHSDIPGIFQPGIAEVMSGIEDVVARVQILRNRTSALVEGDSNSAPLPVEVMGKLQTVDRLLDRTDRFERRMRIVAPEVRGLARSGLDATRALDSMEPAALAGLRTTDTLLMQAQGLIADLDKVARGSDTVARKTSTALEPLARDDSLLVRIRSALGAIDQIESFVVGKTDIKYHFHFFGGTEHKE
ncbi:MAG TPA: MlaD family protein [Fibrobacteria bacterium]|nr:MlaD family protein [Fibrobacteria bacterium]